MGQKSHTQEFRWNKIFLTVSQGGCVMKQKLKERPKEEVLREDFSENKCQHFWDIESANGPSSLGVCRFCGEEKEFLNAFPDFNPLKRRNGSSDVKVSAYKGEDKS
jgi:hypothetical protein